MLTVFGSLNVDLVMTVAQLPRPSETVTSTSLRMVPGGKGANQARAARLMGCPVRLFGATGDDHQAPVALAALSAAGVDLQGVCAMQGRATGLAVVCVSSDGENLIVVDAGANAGLRAEAVPDDVLHESSMLLLQMEVPVAESMIVARRAKAAGCAVMLNAAPVTGLDELDVAALDWLVVNRSELAALCRHFGLGAGTPHEQIEALGARWGLHVVVTLGADGALLRRPTGDTYACPAPTVRAVDTTGAGDAFAGVLAASLAQGLDVPEALTRAVAAGSLACLRPGAQQAQPGLEDVVSSAADLPVPTLTRHASTRPHRL